MLRSFLDKYQGKKVLITGHTGFKGSWLAFWLQHLGADVIGYALEPPTSPNLFSILKLDKLITSITGDIRIKSQLHDVCEYYKPEIVFHLAAQSLVLQSYADPVNTYTTNVLGTVNILETCRHIPSVKAIIIVTSDKCYENNECIRGYRENDPLGGKDPYSSSKACAELITNSYMHSFFQTQGQQNNEKGIATARSGNVIGGGDWASNRIIPDCIRAFINIKAVTIRYPDAVRPWQHVLDPLYGYLLLGFQLYENGPRYIGAWNFGPDDENIKPVRWIVENMIKLWGGNLSWIQSQTKTLHEASLLKLDCSKAKFKLNWHPRIDLKSAVELTTQWYKAYFKNNDMVSYTTMQIKNYEKQLAKK